MLAHCLNSPTNAQMYPQGVAVRQELAHLVSELPALFEQVLAALPSILPAIIYYQSFVHYTTQRYSSWTSFALYFTSV